MFIVIGTDGEPLSSQKIEQLLQIKIKHFDPHDCHFYSDPKLHLAQIETLKRAGCELIEVIPNERESSNQLG